MDTRPTCRASDIYADPDLSGKCSRPAVGVLHHVTIARELPACQSCGAALAERLTGQGWGYDPVDFDAPWG